MTKEEEQENENEAKEGEDRGPSFTSGHLFSASGKPFEEDRRRPRCVWRRAEVLRMGLGFMTCSYATFLYFMSTLLAFFHYLCLFFSPHLLFLKLEHGRFCVGLHVPDFIFIFMSWDKIVWFCQG